MESVKVVSVKSFCGRNVHVARPAVEAVVDLEHDGDVVTSAKPAFTQALLDHLPGLVDHHCGLGRQGGFVQRLLSGTLLGHVAEHVALELQYRVGEPVRYGKTRYMASPALYRVVIEQTDVELGEDALRLAVDLVNDFWRHETAGVAGALKALMAVRGQRSLGPSTQAIAQAARSRGIPVRRIDGSLLVLGQGSCARSVWASLTDDENAVAVDLAQDKPMAKRRLAQMGIPVPEGRVVDSAAAAVAAFAEFRAAAVVKPASGRQGDGVHVGLGTAEEVRDAYEAVARKDRVLVERRVPGVCVRVLVVGARTVAAAVRHVPEVVGDGKRTIRELVGCLNAEPGRGEGHADRLSRIRLDHVGVRLALSSQGLGVDSVVALGRRVRLLNSANLSTGAIAEDVTDILHPDVARLAERAAKAIGLSVAGVDVMVSHPALPLSQTEASVLEVNAAPGLRMHLFPGQGTPRPVAQAIVDHLIPPPSTARIPVVAITGTNGKTTTARLVAHLLRQAGYRVGLAATDGVYVDGTLVMPGDTTGPRSAETVLSDRRVEAAVLECARGGLRRQGLGFDGCQVSCVLNVGADHLGQDGVETLDDLAHVKSIVVEATLADGAAVLNADDARVRTMAARTAAEKVFFSRDPGSAGLFWPMSRRAVVERGGFVVYRDGARERRLVSIRQLPLAFGGASLPMVENALAGAAIGLALGLDPEQVAESLTKFAGDDRSNPGRMNFWSVGGCRLLLDYGHNPPALVGLLNTARNLCQGRLLGVICSPGDRRDRDIRALGEVAGRGFDRVWIKEDEDLRGRRPGEAAALLDQGVRIARGRVPAVIASSEPEAVRAALSAARPADLVILLYESYGRTTALLRSLGAVPLSTEQAIPEQPAVAAESPGG